MGYTDKNENVLPDKNVLNDPDAGYAKAEMDLLKDALRRSHTERFLMATRLYKISIMLKNAKVTHQPFISKD
jgi:hypothetical protein